MQAYASEHALTRQLSKFQTMTGLIYTDMGAYARATKLRADQTITGERVTFSVAFTDRRDVFHAGTRFGRLTATINRDD